MMSGLLQYHSIVCGFYTNYAAFHVFSIRQEEITGVHDDDILLFMSD